MPFHSAIAGGAGVIGYAETDAFGHSASSANTLPDESAASSVRERLINHTPEDWSRHKNRAHRSQLLAPRRAATANRPPADIASRDLPRKTPLLSENRLPHFAGAWRKYLEREVSPLVILQVSTLRAARNPNNRHVRNVRFAPANGARRCFIAGKFAFNSQTLFRASTTPKVYPSQCNFRVARNQDALHEMRPAMLEAI